MKILTSKSPDEEEADSHEDHVKQEFEVGQEAVDGQHGSQGEVVALEVAEVVIDTTLDLPKVCRLGETLDIEELAEGLQIGKASAKRLRADAVESGAEVEARGQSLERDVDACHECLLKRDVVLWNGHLFEEWIAVVWWWWLNDYICQHWKTVETQDVVHT